MRRFNVKAEDSGVRADRFVAKYFPNFTRSSLERLFDNKLIKSNGRLAKAGQKLRQSDVIEVDDSLLKVKAEAIELPIIYEDQNVLVINKPEGVLTHTKGALVDEATVASFLLPRLDEAVPKTNRAGIVHRLDRATSGVIITAKNEPTLKLLQKQFSQRRTKKTYLAVVAGRPENNEAIIDIPIERNPKRPQTFRPGHGGKSAQTTYKVTKEFARSGKEYSLLELKPLTGRTHQLRVHLQHLGCPIVGDKLYGGEPAEHLFLHAAELEVTIPESRREIFKAPLPKYFKDFIK